MLITNRKNILSIVAFCFLSISSATQAERLRVGFLCPAPEEDSPFWHSVVDVMRAAAQDLDIELIVNCSRRGSLATKRAGDVLLQSTPPLDYFITGYWPTVTKNHLATANSNAIKTIVINSRIKEEERADLDSPRVKLRNWIGHMVPDYKQASADLFKSLFELVSDTNNSTETVEVIALLVDRSSAITRDRNKGLRTQAKDLPAVKLHEIPRDYWTINWAAQDVEIILSENTNINAIWAANEASAWGGLLGAEKAGRTPGKDIYIGGFDWNSESVMAIEDSRMSVSMLGHFMEGAWALILAHDYHYGTDFEKDTGVTISTPLVAITPENVSQYKNILDNEFWAKVDFKKFSKKFNPALKSYDFSLSQFLELAESDE